MKTTSYLKTISRILFFVCVFFIVVFFADWFWGPFFFNRDYRVLKYCLSVVVPAGLTVFNYKTEKSLKFIGYSMIIVMSSFVLGFLAFNYLKISPFLFREISSLYHITYALVASFSVFTAATVIAHIEKTDYGFFYNSFFLGYVPMMIMLYALLYFVYRNTETMQYTVNLIPFQGELKNLFGGFNTLSAMRTLGNIAYYSTISLTAARFFKKTRALFAFWAPFALCVVSEAVQGIFSIGDADIDDIILNSLGALIGALIYKFFIEKLRRNNQCLE